MTFALRSDADIDRDIQETLAWDSRLDDREIHVIVSGGVVTLAGGVPTLAQKLIAAEDAWRVKGVREVVNHLEVRPEPARTNEEIAADLYQAVTADPWVDEKSIAINVSGGVVYLTGVVLSAGERQAAEEHAWHVPGVVEVVNDLTVQPTRQRPDREIEQDVRDALLRDARIADPTEVGVASVGGCVELTGQVQDAREREAAEQDAWFTAGVVGVRNNLVSGS